MRKWEFGVGQQTFSAGEEEEIHILKFHNLQRKDSTTHESTRYCLKFKDLLDTTTFTHKLSK